MDFSVTTHWNASRHTAGEPLIEEILALGVKAVELGYDLRMDLVPGVQAMVRSGAVQVVSVHNYCPVPVGAPRGHPELFTMASNDAREREAAIHNTQKTIRFAAEIGARVVIAHAGYVEIGRKSRDLIALCEEGKQFSPEYEKIKLAIQIAREKRAGRHLDHLRSCLDQLVPLLQETGVLLALENLPTWEAVPNELEMEDLHQQYGAHSIRYWHDIGHAQIRHNMGFINQERWIERLGPALGGMHVHDVAQSFADHVMPPRGQVDFAAMKKFAKMDILRVIEPAPQTPKEQIEEALLFLRKTWADEPAESGGEAERRGP